MVVGSWDEHKRGRSLLGRRSNQRAAPDAATPPPRLKVSARPRGSPRSVARPVRTPATPQPWPRPLSRTHVHAIGADDSHASGPKHGLRPRDRARCVGTLRHAGASPQRDGAYSRGTRHPGEPSAPGQRPDDAVAAVVAGPPEWTRWQRAPLHIGPLVTCTTRGDVELLPIPNATANVYRLDEHGCRRQRVDRR
jgi:hypothetical protein